jgi:hypothetical protein
VKPKAGVAFPMNEFYRLWLVIDNTSILLTPEKCNAVILQAALKQC